MSDLEALMWRLGESDPMFRSTMTLVGLLDRPVDRRDLIGRLELVTGVIPRLRDRVAPSFLGPVPPRWEPDPCFDIEAQVRWLPAPGWGTGEDLLGSAEALAAEGFTPERPPWEVVFIDGLRGGRQGVVMRLHHAYTDGLGAVRLAGELFDLAQWPPSDTSSSTTQRFDRPAAAQVVSSRALGQVVEEMETEVRRAAAMVGRVVPWAARSLRDAVFDPEGRARAAVAVAQSVRDQVRRASAPGSTLMTRRSAGVRLAWFDLDLAAVRAAGQRSGGTINDVFLSGLLGGLASYHAKHGPCPSSLRLAIPISTRPPSDGPASDPEVSMELRNQLEATLLRGPLCVADPAERIRLVHEMVRGAREQPSVKLIEELTGLGVRLPGITSAVSRAGRGLDVVASNVPGPPVELYLAGARVERLVPFGPRVGSAINFTLLSYGPTIHIGANVDPAAVPDSSVLFECLRSAFDEVVEA